MQCVAAPELCNHQEFPFQDTVEQIPLTIHQFQRAWYTTMPSGDFVTRSSMWDLLPAGGIPIVFTANFSRYCPYSDMLDWDSLLVYIPLEQVTGPNATSFVDLVNQQHNSTLAKKKLASIRSVAHVFQYSLYSDHSLIHFAARNKLQAGDDAFTFTIKAVLRHICAKGWSAKCSAGHSPHEWTLPS